jgi:hypothetical protein
MSRKWKSVQSRLLATLADARWEREKKLPLRNGVERERKRERKWEREREKKKRERESSFS